MTFIPESIKVVSLLEPAADAGGRTSAHISLKNVQRAWLVAHIDQADVATIVLQPLKATSVAGGGSTAITTAVPIYVTQDAAVDDSQARTTDATSFTTSAATKVKVVTFVIDPAKLGATFDCLGISTDASNAANITSAVALLEMRHQGSTTPSVLTD